MIPYVGLRDCRKRLLHLDFGYAGKLRDLSHLAGPRGLAFGRIINSLDHPKSEGNEENPQSIYLKVKSTEKNRANIW